MAKEKNKAASENAAGGEQSGEFEEVDDGDFAAPDDDLFGDVEEVDELDDDMDELDSDDRDDLSIPRRASEEVGRIKEFLSSISRVRCERYNANLTVIGCHRKKTSTPQRLKNRTSPEDENIQNHPCFGCLGPIIINWPEGSLPITLKARERRPVIVHPLHENAMLSLRPRREESQSPPTSSASFGGEPINSAPVYLKPPNALRSTGAIPTATLPRPSATPAAKAAKPARPKIDIEAEVEEDYDASDIYEDVEGEMDLGGLEDDIGTEPLEDEDLGAIGLESEEEGFSEDFGDEMISEDSDEDAIETKAASKKKIPEIRPKKDKEKDKEKDKAPKKEKDKEKDAEKAPESRAKKEKDKEKAPESRVKKEKDKLPTQKEAVVESEEATSSDEHAADGEHPPCTSCGKEYTPKYWRGDVCNACYAKQLRERKKTTEEKPPRKKKEAPTEVEHPPCTSCGKEYTPKYWRGDVCNACYAKQLRERKRSEDAGASSDTDV